MASPTIYPNGGGGTSGDNVAVRKPIYQLNGGHIWYVGPTGTDAASPAGRQREKPLKTTQQAVTNAASGDTIIYLPNFTETISVAITVGKALTIVSEGTGSARAKLTCAVAAGVMLTLGTVGTSLNNIYFPASTAANTGRVNVTATSGVVCDNCYFECGANDTGATFTYGATASCQLTNATFVAVASQPAIAIAVTGASAGMFFENITLDGGSFGFSDFAFKATAALTGLYADNISQLNNADVSLAAGCSGIWIPGVCSQSADFEQA